MSEKQGKPKPTHPAPSLMDEILEDALAIQERFVPEPMLKTTGRGVLKSKGVDGLHKDAEELRKKFGNDSRAKS